MIDNIYLLHNGVNKGQFFKEMSGIAENLIQYASVCKEHPLVCDECFALQVDEILFDPEDISIVEGEVYLEFNEEDHLMAIKYIEDIDYGEEEDQGWLYPDDAEYFKRVFVMEGLTQLGL